MKPDTLSHRVDHQMGEEGNQDQVMLSAEQFSPNRATSSVNRTQRPEPNKSIVVNGDGPSQVTIKGEGSSFLERVCNCADQEDSVIRALKELNTSKG